MTNDQIEQMTMESVAPENIGEEVEVLADLGGYQVTRAEFFSHTREPSITIWDSRIKFNMACLRKFPGITHIQILMHPELKQIIIRACDPDTPDSIRWAKGGKDNELKNRDLLCRMFAAKVFDLMEWDRKYRYKMLGKIAVYNGEMLFMFKLTEFELFVRGKGSKNAYLPGEWRNYFGTPVEKHEDAYNIDLADGYVTTDKI